MQPLNTPSTPYAADFSFCRLNVVDCETTQLQTQNIAVKVTSPKRKSAFQAYQKQNQKTQTPRISPNPYSPDSVSVQMDDYLKQIWEVASVQARSLPRSMRPLTPRLQPLKLVGTKPLADSDYQIGSLQPFGNAKKVSSLDGAIEIAYHRDANHNCGVSKTKVSPKRSQVSLRSWLPRDEVNDNERTGPVRHCRIQKNLRSKSSNVYTLSLVRDYNSSSIGDVFSSNGMPQFEESHSSKKKRV